jgi:hypothetical protein
VERVSWCLVYASDEGRIVGIARHASFRRREEK